MRAPLLSLCIGLLMFWGCGDDAGTDNAMEDASVDASAASGRAGTGGRSSGGAGGGSGGREATGGRGGEAVDAGDAGDASVDAPLDGPDSADVAVPGDERDAEASTPEAGLDASDTEHPLQGLPPYPTVLYPPENPNDADKAMLGKILFWEEQLGEDNTMACGTCHRASAGGSDPRAATEEAARQPGPDGMLSSQDPPDPFSDDIRGGQGVVRCNINHVRTGTEVQVTQRKPPTYLDAMFAPDIFWDGRAKRDFTDPDTGTVFMSTTDPATGRIRGYGLESQAIGPPLSDVEMACEGQTWSDIHDKLRAAQPLGLARTVPPDMEDFIVEHGNSYPAMFEAAFGAELKQSGDDNDVINTRRIAFAIATHERRLTSNQTPWDRWNAGENDALTPNQLKGFELFMDPDKGNCNNCHGPPLFTNLAFHFIGFHPVSWDEGRKAVDPFAVAGAMKTPTLRNVGLRENGGLLHRGDGPGHDLETVMELYRTGGTPGNRAADAGVPIDSLIVPLNLTDTETAHIIDFMRNALTDPRVKNEEPPFDRPRLCSEDEDDPSDC